MPRRVRQRARRIETLTSESGLPHYLRTWFLTGAFPARGTDEHEALSKLVFPRAPEPEAIIAGHERLREFWASSRDAILAEWVRARPGTRPAGWWRFDSPRDDERPDTESDPTFLDRHKLLLKGELERIPSAAFERIEYPDPYRHERPDPRKTLGMVVGAQMSAPAQDVRAGLFRARRRSTRATP